MVGKCVLDGLYNALINIDRKKVKYPSTQLSPLADCKRAVLYSGDLTKVLECKNTIRKRAFHDPRGSMNKRKGMDIHQFGSAFLTFMVWSSSDTRSVSPGLIPR